MANNEKGLPTPIPRKEKFLAKAAGMDVEIPKAITREEMYLEAIANGSGGGGGGFTPTESQLTAMNSGITSTDVAQINTNKNSITDIKDGTSINSFGDVEDALDDKADKSATYTKTEVDTALDSKANTSDIPTVPIAAIQKNGTGITPVSGTVNITVPTTAADVSALPDTTKYATALSLTINSSTFVMTGQLKDQNGDNIGAAQTIDLPLESVVVGGSYNSQTQKVVLTLQNGNTVEFSVADLVSGLQTELSASNKLNPEFINYDSTHRAVSDTEKSTWNGKQNAIDSSHKLSADLVDDINATNKFATAEELEQIQTNKNNISYIANNNVINILNRQAGTYTSNGVTFTTNIDGSITLSGTATNAASVLAFSSSLDTTDDTYILYGDGFIEGIYMDTYENGWSNQRTFTSWVETNPNTKIWRLIVSNGTNADGVTLRPMMCKKSLFDGLYHQPAMSNAELTAAIQALQAQLANKVISKGADDNA